MDPLAATAPNGSGVSVQTLELFVELLSQTRDVEAPGQGFYDRLCEAVCRLTRMRRAVIFRYDPASRRVRAAGAHKLDLAQFADAHVSVESLPMTAQALKSDGVVEIDGDLRDQIPPQFATLMPEPARLVCAPMVAAGWEVGVILCDRPLSEPPLDAAERNLLWTVGKTAALAGVARAVVKGTEEARQLSQRIDLARDIHEGVIQRLFGVSMALDGEGDLPAEARVRCAAETQRALGELRSALQRPLARAPRETGTTLMEEVRRLAHLHPHLGIELVQAADVPPPLEPLAQSILVEAVRNAQKHAQPSHVTVRVARGNGTFLLEVVNDGVTERARAAGMGLRLAALEALHAGGVVEFGERGPGRWQVRLVVPDGSDDEQQ